MEKIARSYIQSQDNMTKSKVDPVLIHTEYNSSKKTASSNIMDAAYYVFGKGYQRGFIIVSADDITVPIPGYVEARNFEQNNLPPNYVYWMQSLAGRPVFFMQVIVLQPTCFCLRWL